MDHPILILVLLGLAAAFMPWQTTYEAYLLGEEKGYRKALSFVTGITFLRVLIICIFGLLFVGVTAAVTDRLVDVAQLAQSLLALLGREITSGQRALLDALLILSGLLLLVEAYQSYRGTQAGPPPEEMSEEARKGRSVWGIFLVGFAWTAVSIKQWLLTLTATNQILFVANDLPGGLLLALLFLLLASLMILLPLLLYILRPDSAVDTMARFNDLIENTFGYAIIILMAAGGLYLIWIGSRGLLNYAAAPGGLF